MFLGAARASCSKTAAREDCFLEGGRQRLRRNHISLNPVLPPSYSSECKETEMTRGGSGSGRMTASLCEVYRRA